jgi:molybdenum-dependent DNA-binding transcriptional regulator ModE
MDIEELRTFVQVADAGSVALAARRLGVSKSIVSRRLARLEQDLGVQLLARSTHGAALTEAGAAFRDHAARVCSEIDIAKKNMLPSGLFAAGYVSLHCSLSAGHILLQFSRRWHEAIRIFRSAPVTATTSWILLKRDTTAPFGSVTFKIKPRSRDASDRSSASWLRAHPTSRLMALRKHRMKSQTTKPLCRAPKHGNL